MTRRSTHLRGLAERVVRRRIGRTHRGEPRPGRLDPGLGVVVVALSIASFTYGGLLGGFFLAVLWKRASQLHALIGMATGIAAMTFVVFARQISAIIPPLEPVLAPFTRIAWPWYVLIGTSITMIVGITSSLLVPRPRINLIK